MKFSFYLVRRGFILFISVLLGLTALVWVTQALRKLDLITAKGQTILTFAYMTLLALPMLLVIVAPFAMIAAMAILLSQMHGDREIVAIEASGASPWRVLRPLVFLALAVGIGIAALGMDAVPRALHSLRDRTTAMRADVLTSIVQPGKFVSLEDNFTFHLSNRLADGSLAGLFFHDERDPVYALTYSAERGTVVDAGGRTLLIMERGSMERRRKSDTATTFVAFDTYAFDLTDLRPDASGKTVYDPTETLMDDLAAQLGHEPDPRRNALVVQEFHTRLTNVFYPLAVTLVMFVFLGSPQSARRGRPMRLTIAIITASLVRVAGFAAANVVTNQPPLWPVMWIVPLALIGLAIIALILTNHAPAGLRPKKAAALAQGAR